eukprot:GHVU01206909.1.p1 GENE.GHVU01206909.1~~GHVU01206909.1.p1  ORF type:complete len:316 (+),score=55.05 GHVU01206909.1:137-1084(+)
MVRYCVRSPIYLLITLLAIFCIISIAEESKAGARASASKAEEPLCRSSLGFAPENPPYNRIGRLPFCKQHASRTCCEWRHAEAVRRRVEELAATTSLRPECKKYYAEVLCSRCDGDVGTGLKSVKEAPTICPTLCSAWYAACAAEFFSIKAASRSATPCAPSDTLCAPMNAIFGETETTQFCEIAAPVKVSAYGCYDGVPSSVSKGAGPRPPTPPKESSVAAAWRTAARRAAAVRGLAATYAPLVLALAVATFWLLRKINHDPDNFDKPIGVVEFKLRGDDDDDDDESADSDEEDGADDPPTATLPPAAARLYVT